MIDKIKKWARKLKDNLKLLYAAYINPKTPWYAKVLAIIVLAYAFSPIDLIPDFIPVLGYLDDLLLIPLGIYLCFKLIPKEIIEEPREKDLEFPGLKSIGKYGAPVIVIIWVIIIYYVYKLIVQ